MNTVVWILAAVAAAQEIVLLLMLRDNAGFRRRMENNELPGNEKDKLIHNLMAACTAQFSEHQKEREFGDRERSILWRKNEELQARADALREENGAQKKRIDRMIGKIQDLEQRMEEEDAQLSGTVTAKSLSMEEILESGNGVRDIGI